MEKPKPHYLFWIIMLTIGLPATIFFAFVAWAEWNAGKGIEHL